MDDKKFGNNHLFGHYLVKKGYVTPSDIYEALNYQKATKLPIGRVAVDNGMLTIRQVLDVLNCQSLSDSRPFGEIAISLGYLTAEQVEKILAIQKTSVKPIGEVLEEIGAISHETLIQELDKYKKEYNL